MMASVNLIKTWHEGMIIAALPSSVIMCTEHMVYSKTNANLVLFLCALKYASLCV